MNKKEFTKIIREFVKYINENLESLGLAEELMISPKATVEEMETVLEGVGDIVGENFAEGDIPVEFEELYEKTADAFEEYKSSLQTDSKGDAEGSGTGDEESSSDSGVDEKTGSVEKGDPDPNPTPESEKKQTKKQASLKTPPKSQKKAAPKMEGVVEEMAKAVKKMFDVLPEEAIDSLDAATTRVILKIIK